MKAKAFESFVRAGVLDVLVRNDTVIIGLVEPEPSDLRISGNRHAGYLTMALYTSSGVKQLGGRIRGTNRRLNVSNAVTLRDVVIALGAHEFFITAAALLVIDARSRCQTTLSFRPLPAAESPSTECTRDKQVGGKS